MQEPLETRREKLWSILSPAEGKAAAACLCLFGRGPDSRHFFLKVTFAVYRNFNEINEEEIQAPVAVAAAMFLLETQMLGPGVFG